MKQSWKDAPLSHRIVTIISVISSLSVVVFAILQLFDIWNSAINICIPMMGVLMGCQTYIQWNNDRKVAYFNLGATIFIFICTVVVFFID